MNIQKPFPGERSTCTLCGRAVMFIGSYWAHTEAGVRHIARPSMLPAVVTIKATARDDSDEVLLKGVAAAGDLAELRIQATGEDGKPKIPTFDMLAYTGTPIFPSGWYQDDPIIFDIAGMSVIDSVPVNAGHYTDIGHTTKVEKTTKAIKASGVLSAFSAVAEDDAAVQVGTIVRMGANGFPYQASIEARAPRKKIEYVPANESTKVNGRTFPGPVYVARQSTLTKIAILTGAADVNTQTTIAATQRGNIMEPEFVEWLKANEHPDAPTAKQLPSLKAGWQASKTPPPPEPRQPVIDLAERRKHEAAEDRRIAGIRAAFAKYPKLTAVAHPTEPVRNGTPFTMPVEEFRAHAIESNLTVDEVKLVASEAELTRIRTERPTGIHIAAHSHDATCTREALTAAIMIRSGAKLDHPSYQSLHAIERGIPAFLRAGINDANKNQIFEAAHQFSDMSAIDIARECCRLTSGDIPHRRDDMIRASFSGGTLDKIFTDSINAHLTAVYEEAPDSTEGWTQETDVADFKTQSDIRLTKGQGLSRLPRGGKADNMSRGDEAETYQIARYAGEIVVDEQDMIDDTLNALADLPDEMGKAAARLRPDLVYAILLANPTLLTTARQLFNATDDNVDTASALALATIGAGIANMMLKQENGVNLNLVPTHLIVPTSLRLSAKEFIGSQQILVSRAGTTDTTVVRGVDNVVWDEGLTLVSDARIENGVLDPSTEPKTLRSGSATTWYLACALARTIIVAYRRGTGRAPQVRSKILDGGRYGMQWDINMDIGAKARDYRGLYRATA
jgi:hypothetical protein